MILAPQDLVVVRGGHGRRVYKPWKARVVRVGPAWGSDGPYGADRCEVLPVESGRGWTTQPVVVRLAVLEKVG